MEHSLKTKRYFVAGGSGLVGTHLVRRLATMGHDVTASHYLREPAAFPELYTKYDFTHFEDCMHATVGRDVLIICSSVTSGVQEMKVHPTAALLPNLSISAGLLEAAARNHVGRVILISSSTVYQEYHGPVREDQLDLSSDPHDLYYGVGWLNRYMEKLATFYNRSHGMVVGILRPSSIYRPFDSFDDAKSHVIPALIKRALAKESPFVVWGNGLQFRDFVFVEDVVSDIYSMAEAAFDVETLNSGSGVAVSIAETVRLVLEACDHRADILYNDAKPASIGYRALDLTRLISRFGLRPRTSLQEGIQRTVDWYRQQQ
jgi:GDP-L-fucose synthase